MFELAIIFHDHEEEAAASAELDRLIMFRISTLYRADFFRTLREVDSSVSSIMSFAIFNPLSPTESLNYSCAKDIARKRDRVHMRRDVWRAEAVQFSEIVEPYVFGSDGIFERTAYLR